MPSPPHLPMPDNNNNDSPDGTASTNKHSNVETSSREGSEPTSMLDADRGEAVVADRQSVSAEGIIDRQDGGKQPETASVAPKPGPSPPHSDTEQSIPRCRYNLRPRKKKIVKL
ncbi:unnamed protein product [Parnassius apollo]|uniref:(apollo) hypothetical protein n=1 Tax=Parnassius apollo TaxID=110799 RepID=A0A8S3XR48_PARAO|nr:unnamed protein product [Parnassius apollo]